jgi:hypothetical protein
MRMGTIVYMLEDSEQSSGEALARKLGEGVATNLIADKIAPLLWWLIGAVTTTVTSTLVYLIGVIKHWWGQHDSLATVLILGVCVLTIASIVVTWWREGLRETLTLFGMVAGFIVAGVTLGFVAFHIKGGLQVWLFSGAGVSVSVGGMLVLYSLIEGIFPGTFDNADPGTVV